MNDFTRYLALYLGLWAASFLLMIILLVFVQAIHAVT